MAWTKCATAPLLTALNSDNRMTITLPNLLCNANDRYSSILCTFVWQWFCKHFTGLTTLSEVNFVREAITFTKVNKEKEKRYFLCIPALLWYCFLSRIVFRSSSSATKWMQRNRYFHILSRGVERDGWRFVLLARFSPIPSYIINYGLAATRVGFFVDFLLPTVIGCMPMILQNTSIGSLAGAAVSSSTSLEKSRVWSYIFPLLGILSSILISFRVKRYSTGISAAAGGNNIGDSIRDTAVDSAQTLPDPTKKIQ